MTTGSYIYLNVHKSIDYRKEKLFLACQIGKSTTDSSPKISIWYKFTFLSLLIILEKKSSVSGAGERIKIPALHPSLIPLHGSLSTLGVAKKKPPPPLSLAQNEKGEVLVFLTFFPKKKDVVVLIESQLTT